MQSLLDTLALCRNAAMSMPDNGPRALVIERLGEAEALARDLKALAAKPAVTAKELPNTNGIKMFFHCSRCLRELPSGESPASWARLSIGFTNEGLQVWCARHDLNVAHIHFEGAQHPCNTTAAHSGPYIIEHARRGVYTGTSHARMKAVHHFSQHKPRSDAHQFSSFAQAGAQLEKMDEAGIKGLFVVAFNGGTWGKAHG